MANKKADFTYDDVETIKRQPNVKDCWFNVKEGLYHYLMKNGTEWTRKAKKKTFPPTSVESTDSDIIGHPDHYCKGRKYEPKDVIRDWNLNFNLGNTVKYISRCGRKENNSLLQDLQKARQYLDFEIKFLEENENVVN